MLPSFGSFGKKGALTSLGSGRKSFVKDRYGNLDEDDTREGLPSDDEEVSVVGRHRSHSNLSASRVILEGEDYQAAPPMRRIHTTPPTRTKLVRAIYNFDGGASDELTFRADDVIEVKKEVSDDWWIGEIHGRSGLFPSSFCEIVASPITATPSLPKRSVPPPREMPTSPMLDLTSDSEHSHGFSDADDRVKIPLYASAQPTATRPTKKPAPPPPPSKRSASSNNIITAHTVNSSPPPSFARARSNTASRQPILDSPLKGSPFGGSDDEDENDGVPTPVAGGLSHGLATVHLANNGTSHGKCSACSCDDFTQNVFKAKGMCSSCYHQH